MEQKPNNRLDEEHDLPPVDKTTKNKIDKHLKDIDDTISEEDMKNINTGTGTTASENPADIDEANEILEDKVDEEETDDEAPSSWEILGG